MAAVGIVGILSFRTLHPDQLKNAASRPQIGIREGYAKVLANPKARICYAAVFFEGLFVFGYFPYVSVSLIANHLGGVREGGFVIGGIGIGGVIFSLLAGRLLARFGRRRLMIVGGGIVLLAFLADGQISSWQAQLAAFAGIGTGFYMLHSALQTEATELAPEVRGSAVALHAFFFFIGQAVGPFSTAGLASDRRRRGDGACRRRRLHRRDGREPASQPCRCDDRTRRSASAIRGNALVRQPEAGRRRFRLPENIDRNAAARIPVTADAEPSRLEEGGQPLADSIVHASWKAPWLRKLVK